MAARRLPGPRARRRPLGIQADSAGGDSPPPVRRRSDSGDGIAGRAAGDRELGPAHPRGVARPGGAAACSRRGTADRRGDGGSTASSSRVRGALPDPAGGDRRRDPRQGRGGAIRDGELRDAPEGGQAPGGDHRQDRLGGPRSGPRPPGNGAAPGGAEDRQAAGNGGGAAGQGASQVLPSCGGCRCATTPER